MDRILDAFHWLERLAIVAFKACLFLYVLRCVVTLHIVSFVQFLHLLRVLISLIFG